MNIPTHNSPPQRSLARAFSLPEVTMAVGIAAMAIVLLLGLVPSGLQSVRDAAQTLAESRIYQQIVGEIQSADWGNLTAGAQANDPLAYPLLSQYQDARRYFDDQGTPLTNNQEQSLRLAYVARITLNRDGQLAVPNGQPSGNMVGVTIDVASVPDASYDFPPRGIYSTRSFVVARQY